MKFRSGFVSNSSSSSYALILKQEDFDTLMSKASALAQAIANEIKRTRNLAGTPITVLSWTDGNNDSFEYTEFDSELLYEYRKSKSAVPDDDDDDDVYDIDVLHECWDEFVRDAKKLGVLIETES